MWIDKSKFIILDSIGQYSNGFETEELNETKTKYYDKLQDTAKKQLNIIYGTFGKLKTPGRFNKANTNPIYIKKKRRKK